MKWIMSNTEVVKLLPAVTDIDASKQYRFLTYIVRTPHDNGMLLLNTLTRNLVYLNLDEYDRLFENQDSQLFRDLAKGYFVVPENTDESKLNERVQSVSKLLDKNNGFKQYVIFTTMECNARCFYCFEHGAQKSKMVKQTAEDVADFIIKRSRKKGIKIQWFGGEPLYNMEAIEIITEKLINANIRFKSVIISNGYLFDETIVEQAKEKWHIDLVQITIDGTEKIYNRVKNYIYRDDISPFKRVVNNIELLVKSGVKVMVRLNMDKHNKEDLFGVVELLHNRLGEYHDLLTVYAWLLYDNRGTKKKIRDEQERHQLTMDLMELEEYIKECGFIQKKTPYKGVRLYSCLADNPQTTVILPDGKLGRCDHHTDDEFYGSIYDEKINTEVIKSWTELRMPVALCKNCPIAPECKRLRKCPDDGAYDCDTIQQKQRVKVIENQMMNAYKQFLKS